MADLKSMFKAARDQRGTQTSVKKLVSAATKQAAFCCYLIIWCEGCQPDLQTKEQIRELRAKQAAETVQKERAAAAKAAAMQQVCIAALCSTLILLHAHRGLVHVHHAIHKMRDI